MNEAPRVPSLDAVPEFLRDQFVEVDTDDGKAFEYHPPRDPREAKTGEELANLKTALRQEREGRRREAEERANKLVLDGEELNPDELRTWRRETREQLGKQMISVADAERQAEERLAKLRKSSADDLAAREQLITQRDKTIHEIVVDRAILDIASGTTETPFRLEDGAVNHFRLLASAGAIKVIDGKPVPVDADGTPRTNRRGEIMSLLEWMASVVETEPYLAKKSTGAGVHANGNGLNGTVKKKLSEMNFEEKSAFIGKHGEAKFLELLNAQ